MNEIVPDKAPFVTFYSYKGGVGRSMAVLNVSALLSARGFRVLIIDFDLEAPGLSHLHGRDLGQPKMKKKQGKPPKGVVELLADAKTKGERADLFGESFAEIASRYTFELPVPAELAPDPDGSLHVMPAGFHDSTYAARLDALDLAGLYRQGTGQALMLHFKDSIVGSGLYDYVIVDSRTGHSDEAGICTRDLADHLIVVSGFNRQNIAGTASFLSNLRAALGAEAKNPDIILSPVPIGEEQLLNAREKEAAEFFEQGWGASLPLGLAIPYHPRLALTEDAYVTTRTTSYLKTAYAEVEARLLDSLEHRPWPLLKGAAEAIRAGNGALALGCIHRASKLSDTSASSSRGSISRWEMHLDLWRNDQLLSQLLKLPEATAILEYIAKSQGPSFYKLELAKKLHNLSPKHRQALDQVILEEWKDNPEILGSYANTLAYELKQRRSAFKFYRRSIEADPQDANALGNFANFLSHTLKKKDAGEKIYKLAIATAPQHSNNLGNYAVFLSEDRKNHDSAEEFFKRAIVADPQHANNLCNYANFLKNRREDHDAAEDFYKRALSADPESVASLVSYAIFLANIRQKSDLAEQFYERALSTDPENANTLINYGQLLLGSGRLQESLKTLHIGWEKNPDLTLSDQTELSYVLSLTQRLAGSPQEVWERVFKHALRKGFNRGIWNFDRIWNFAADVLDADEFRYAKALGEAFLDEGKVAALEDFPRWRALEPLDPSLVSSDGSIRGA